MNSTDAMIAAQIRAVLTAAEAGDGLAPIVEAGDPVLRSETRPFDGQVDDAELKRFAEVMRATMLAAPGVGLAAPQVGVSLSMFVAEDPGARDPEVAEVRQREPMPLRVVLNAEYERATSEDVAFYEGCLSIPGYQAVVARPREIELRGTALNGDPIAEVVSGWSARIVAHETDHLAGILFLDRAEMRSLATNASVSKFWHQPSTQKAAAELGFALPSGMVM
ncbi:peptide deformylase [Brevibacterium spongiae]|uniref:Peptide deformylase n=1 Tax=Brevibacterium spongiae TaxID=2909672 RepID=A0ABY5SWH5_9MICO|nr:peptide deformylase [Brevibacterium spongiae]UVI37054.1 peptide deformylase [Brevibacterium spongiae]